MTIEQLVEEMEENEDTVECAWCEDLFDKSECRYEVGAGGPDDGLGWLCSRCEMAIKSRGETLTFRENNYWDFLDEDAEPHDLGNEYDGGYPATQTWVCYFDGIDIGTVEAVTEDEALEKMQREYPEYPYGLRKHDDCWWVELENVNEDLTEASLTDIMAGVNHEYGTNYTERDILDAEGIDDGEFFNDLETQNEITAEAQRNKRMRQIYAIKKAQAAKAAKTEGLTEAKNPDEIVLYYADLDYDFVADKDVVTDALVNLVTDEEVQRLTNGRFQSPGDICDYDSEHYYKNKAYLADPTLVHEWTKFLDDNCEELLAAHEQEVLDALRSDAEKAFQEDERQSEEDNEWLNYADYLYHSRKDAELDD
jgi:hypothetical protein